MGNADEDGACVGAEVTVSFWLEVSFNSDVVVLLSSIGGVVVLLDST